MHFEPDGDWQTQAGAKIYRESGRTVAYVGDWHTHPTGRPRPSHRDEATAEDIAKDPAFRTPYPLYAILGKSKGRLFARGSWDLSVYVWDQCLQAAEIEVFS